MFLNSALEIDYKNIFAGLHIYYISMDAKSNLHSSSVFFFLVCPANTPWEVRANFSFCLIVIGVIKIPQSKIHL